MGYNKLDREHFFNHPTITVFIGSDHVALATGTNSGAIFSLSEAKSILSQYTGRIVFNDAISSMRLLFPDFYVEKNLDDLGFQTSLLTAKPTELTPIVDPFEPHTNLLNECFSMWHIIDQLEPNSLYTDVFQPSLNIRLKYLYSNPPLDSDKMNRNQQIVDDLCGWLDLREPVIYLNQKEKADGIGSFYELFSPLSDKMVLKLMKQLGYPAYYDLSELLWLDDQYHLVQTILDCQNLSQRREYAIPVTYEAVEQWEPNKTELANQAFSLGYIEGPLGQRFHTPLAKKCVQSAPTKEAIVEAKQALQNAHLSQLLLYKHLVKVGSIPLNITSTEITYGQEEKKDLHNL